MQLSCSERYVFNYIWVMQSIYRATYLAILIAFVRKLLRRVLEPTLYKAGMKFLSPCPNYQSKLSRAGAHVVAYIDDDGKSYEMWYLEKSFPIDVVENAVRHLALKCESIQPGMGRHFVIHDASTCGCGIVPIRKYNEWFHSGVLQKLITAWLDSCRAAGIL